MAGTAGLGINVAAQVGHSAVRRWVLGPEAHEREATPDEIATMRAMVREGMDAGGIGFTTSRVAHQKGEFGEPIPSFVAHEDEIFELAGVLRDLGRGIIGINPRTKSLEFVQEDKDQLYTLAARTGRPVNWNEFNQRDAYPGQWRVLLDYMEHAQELGAMVYAVMRCQRMDMHFNLRETHAFNRSQLWRDFMARPTEDQAPRARRRGPPAPADRRDAASLLARRGRVRAPRRRHRGHGPPPRARRPAGKRRGGGDGRGPRRALLPYRPRGAAGDRVRLPRRDQRRRRGGRGR